MYIDPHDAILFAHVLLFGYWLGADLGVFFCDSQLTRSDLDIEERMRVRSIRYKIDMAPRTCLVLIVGLGFTLALRFGSPLTGLWLTLVWAACLAWLGIIWAARLRADTPFGKRLSRLDRAVWWGVGALMVGYGAYRLTVADSGALWLALKILIFGVITWNGIWIMWVGDRWYPLIAMVRAGGESRVRGEALMKANRRWAATSAGVLWFLVLVMAFLGTAKPI